MPLPTASEEVAGSMETMPSRIEIVWQVPPVRTAALFPIAAVPKPDKMSNEMRGACRLKETRRSQYMDTKKLSDGTPHFEHAVPSE